jgi:hypothetical protein
VKYLGVKVAVEKKDQIRISKEQITKNVQLLKWRLKRVDNNTPKPQNPFSFMKVRLIIKFPLN